MKIRAEIYKEMYLNPTTTGIVDDIPPNMYEFIYDIFVADKSGKITSMPNSSALTIEEFVEQNRESFPSKINDFHDIYIVDEKTFQTLQCEQQRKLTAVSFMTYFQNKLAQYSSCVIRGKPH
jgi:delta-aminolevulinic acid dehydratase/porphobilinogen synthase